MAKQRLPLLYSWCTMLIPACYFTLWYPHQQHHVCSLSCHQAKNKDILQHSITGLRDSPYKGPMMRKLFACYDAVMKKMFPSDYVLITWCLTNCLMSYGALQWRHNRRDSVSNHQPHDCLLNRLFRRRSKKTSKLRVTGLCAGNSHRWIPRTNGQLCGKCFHLLTSSWSNEIHYYWIIIVE